ncbi:MAG: hypothetical protein GY847_30505 [Proteobacteria bacterium]|nr:hypothetical protein [Pseudomonadota bacterium]
MKRKEFKGYVEITLIMLTLFLSGEPNPAAGTPLKLSDVDNVYPISPEWKGTTVLNISDLRTSTRLNSMILRRLLVAGADIRMENRIGSTIESWIETSRLKRLLKKHNPAVVIVTFDANVNSQPKAEKYTYWAKTIAEQIAPTTCYWLGPSSLIGNQYNLNETLTKSTAPCRYLDPRVITPLKETSKKQRLTKAQSTKWAERMWYKLNNKNFKSAR